MFGTFVKKRKGENYEKEIHQRTFMCCNDCITRRRMRIKIRMIKKKHLMEKLPLLFGAMKMNHG